MQLAEKVENTPIVITEEMINAALHVAFHSLMPTNISDEEMYYAIREALLASKDLAFCNRPIKDFEEPY